MTTSTTLLPFEDWTLRVRPSRARRILLMLHGWTGDENSMWVFARNFPSDYYILAPRAPHPAPQGGYSWRAPAPPGWPTLDLMRPSAQALLDLLDGFARAYDLDASSVDVIGFSQGGAMTFTLAWLASQRIRKVGILAGFAPQGAEEMLRPGMLAGRHAFVAHGTQDTMVPLAMAHHTVHLLEQAGARVTYCESETGHKLSAECLAGLEQYLQAD